jgi:hypothetical protein
MTEVATGALVDDRYRILSRIGSGGMARTSTWAARWR